MTVAGLPPGRAGRLWLTRRMSVAARGADQLERKTQILSAEVARWRHRADAATTEWERACRTALTWGMRAALIDGHDGIRHAWPVCSATVDVARTSTIGVSHLAAMTLRSPEPPDGASSATMHAARAHVAALRAGGQAAVALDALRALEAELSTTRRRVRVLRDHWLPRLGMALADLNQVLEQAEQEDHARLRRLERRRNSPE